MTTPEPKPFLETLRPVRARTAARLEAEYMKGGPERASQSCFVRYGTGFSNCFSRNAKGVWYRVKPTRNPAYWNRDNATVICDASAPSPMPMLFCRYPMTEVTIHGNLGPRLVRALNRLTRKEWGKSLRADGLVIECVGVDHWERTKLGSRFLFANGKFHPVK